MKLQHNHYFVDDKEDWYFTYGVNVYTNGEMGLRKSLINSCRFSELTLIKKLLPYQARYPK